MAVLWAQTQLPEITIANQSLLKTGVRNASHVEVFLAVSSKGSRSKLKREGLLYLREFSTEYASGVTIAYRKQFPWILMPLLPRRAASSKPGHCLEVQRGHHLYRSSFINAALLPTSRS